MWCLLFAACWLLFVVSVCGVGCFMFVVCLPWVPVDVWWWSRAVCCVLPTGCCLVSCLVLIARWLLRVVRVLYVLCVGLGRLFAMVVVECCLGCIACIRCTTLIG